MYHFWVYLAFGLGVFMGLGIFVHKEPGERAFAALIALALFGFATFYLAPAILGYGYVTSWTESFDGRLDNGTTYQTIASTQSGSSYVLLVKKFGTSDFIAIRVKTVPPPLFALVSGKPVGIPTTSTAATSPPMSK